MKEIELAAIAYLEREPLWHMDMLEALRRGRGEVIFFEGRTVLIRRNETSDSYLLTSDGPAAAEGAFAGLPAPRWVVARGPGVPEMIRERFGLVLSEYCCNAAYLKPDRFREHFPFQSHFFRLNQIRLTATIAMQTRISTG